MTENFYSNGRCKDYLAHEATDRPEFEKQVILTMIRRTSELEEAFENVENELGSRSCSVSIFLDAVISAASVWTAEHVQTGREQARKLNELKSKISSLAENLAENLEEFDEINGHPFSADAPYHIVDVAVNASDTNALFNGYVKERLENLSNDFGIKYWPKLSGIMRSLSTGFFEAEVQAGDSVTEAATSSTRSSKADQLRAMLQCIEDRKSGQISLPSNLRLSDETLASFLNVAFDLSGEDLVDGPYVKNLRSRDKKIKPLTGWGCP